MSANETFKERKFWALMPGFALVQFLMASFGLRLATLDINTSPFWPATGFAIAIVFLYGYSFSIAIFLGTFIADIFIAGTPMLPSVFMAMGGLFESLIGAFIVRYIFSKKIEFEYLSEVIAVVSAALLSPIASAFLGTLGVAMGSSDSTFLFYDVWLTWWTGSCIGALTVLPLVLAVKSFPWGQLSYKPVLVIKFFSLLILLLASLLSSFRYTSSFGSVFLIFPVFLLIQMNLGPLSLFASSFGACVFAVFLTLKHIGPFVGGHTNENLLNLQLFLASMALTVLVLDSLKRTRRLRFPAIALLVSWILSSVLVYSFHVEEIRKDISRFDRLTNDMQNNIEVRMNAYIDALYGGISLWAVTSEMTMEKWRAFYSTYKVDSRYPGITGMGVILPMKSKDLDSFIKNQKSHIADFSVKAASGFYSLEEAQKKYGDNFIITYIEPMRTNSEARGLDIGTEPHRRYAAEASRDSGKPYITGSIVLVQDQKKRPGFLLFLPFYKQGVPLDTKVQRRRYHLGWVYAPFVTEEFFAGILSLEKREISMRVYEGNEVDKKRLHFASTEGMEQGAFEKVSTLNLAGVPFVIEWGRTAEFESTRSTIIGWVTLSCTVFSLLLSIVISTLQSIGFRAQSMTDAKTAELRKSEQQLIQANKEAVKGVKAKAAFLANMSHEIRTPLNGIIGVADLLFETELTDEQRKYSEIIQNSSNNLLSIINDILDFSKIEAGKLQLENIPFNLASVTEEQADLMIAKARAKGLSLMSYIDPLLPRELVGDPSRIGQILSNLISNAIKFTKVGGVRVFVIKAKNPLLNPNMKWIRFEVVDSGIGIAEENVGRLFQAFSQIDDSTSRHYGGSGLGLSICKNLVELMGGQIGAQSLKDHGSTFWFEIPLEISLKVRELKPFEELHDVASLRILVTDPDAITRDVIDAYLFSWGITHKCVLTFEEAEQAIMDAKAEGYPYDLVFLGSWLHFGKALRVGKEWQFHFGTPMPNLILMPEFENNISLDAAKEYGFLQILRKPIKQSMLFDTLSWYFNTTHPLVSESKKIPKRGDSPQKAALSRKRILVVDDVAINRQVIVQMLEKIGYSAASVASGKEALEALGLVPFDIVFMDIQMPDMDGYQATKHIRKSSDLRIRETIIIALTANALEGDEAKCRDAGMDDYLAKPIKKSMLEEKLRIWFNFLDKSESPKNHIPDINI